MLETVRSIRLTLDAEMQRMTGGLQVLALTDTLQNGDFESFRRIAAGFLEQYGKDGVMLVADREGQQLFSSLTPDTASLPPRNNRDIVEKVFATKHPQYSNLFIGAVKKQTDRHRRSAGVSRRRGDLRHFLQPAARDVPVHPRKAAAEQGLDALDLRRRRHQCSPACRTRRRPSASAPRRRCYAEMLRKSEAALPTVSLEGVPLIAGFARSSLTGWIVAAGISESSLVAPLWRNLAITSADRRRAAADRACLCGADGDDDRARRDAARPADRGAQSPRQEHAGDPAGDRGADLPQREPAPSARNSRAGSARWPRRTICSARRSGRAPSCRT